MFLPQAGIEFGSSITKADTLLLDHHISVTDQMKKEIKCLLCKIHCQLSVSSGLENDIPAVKVIRKCLQQKKTFFAWMNNKMEDFSCTHHSPFQTKLFQFAKNPGPVLKINLTSDSFLKFLDVPAPRSDNCGTITSLYLVSISSIVIRYLCTYRGTQEPVKIHT